jgi:hypothetical protein
MRPYCRGSSAQERAGSDRIQSTSSRAGSAGGGRGGLRRSGGGGRPRREPSGEVGRPGTAVPCAFHPPITAVVVGRDGSTWLRWPDEGTGRVRWDVLDGSGQPLRRLVEGDAAVVALGEYAIEDDDVEVEVRVNQYTGQPNLNVNSFSGPEGVAVDRNGNVYGAEVSQRRKYTWLHPLMVPVR